MINFNYLDLQHENEKSFPSMMMEEDMEKTEEINLEENMLNNPKKYSDLKLIEIENRTTVVQTNEIINANNNNINKIIEVEESKDVKIKISSKDLINKKGNKKIKRKKRKGNASYKIYSSCANNLHYFIKKNYKYININKPTVTNNKKKSHEAMRELFNKTLYELYCDNKMSKRFKGDIEIKEIDINKRKEIKQKKYKEINKNKKSIDNILKNNNQQDEILFKEIKFQDFLIAYLNNENEIIKRDKNNKVIFNLKLTGFETYEQFFNGEYTREEKEKYKNHIFNIMNNESWDKQLLEVYF